MKKLAILFFCMLTCLFCTPKASAADKYLTSKGTSIHVALDENGDARITEERSYYFGGDTITRCRRHYRFEGGTMSDFQVWLDGQPMTMLGAPDDNRPEGYAAAYHNSDGYHVDVYMHCLDEVHTFTISYLVTDAVFLHTEDDRAEFEWDLSSDDEPSDIANFEAEILLPSAVDANALQIHTSGVSDDWRYHSEDGSIYSIQLTADRVSKDQAATIYIEMPRSLVPGATRVESTDSPKDEDDTMQTILHIFYDFLPFVGIGGLVFLLILSTFLKLVEQYSTGRKKLAALRLAPQTDAFLQETIPEELPPAIVSKLYSVYFPYDPDPFTIPAYQRNNSFAVTILDLANRGVLTLQPLEKDLVIQVNQDPSMLSSFEKSLVELLIAAVPKDGVLTMKALDKYASKHAKAYTKKMNEFGEVLQSEFDALGLTQKAGHQPNRLREFCVFAAVSILSAILFVTQDFTGFGRIANLIAGILNGAVITAIAVSFYHIFAHPFTILTQAGEERLARWQAYARYLDRIISSEMAIDPSASLPMQDVVLYGLAFGRQSVLPDKLQQLYPQSSPSASSDDDWLRYQAVSNLMDQMNHSSNFSSSDSSSGSDSSGCDSGGCDSGGCDSGCSGGDFD